jgi:DNA polymerase I-like protein with 3'-5' exonuclease and polymerase domains
MLGEVDYSGVEVRISACCHKDPAMLKYIHDPSTDMHRDQAREIFMKKDVTKEERYLAKNGFVFPEFYGSYYAEIAPRIWKDMPMETREHLRSKNVSSYRRFESHIEDVEYKFWNEKFPVYNQWKIDQWKKFQSKGKIELFTGFIARGALRKNQVLNLPIQGPAFHCLLWSLIHFERWLRETRKKTLIIGQIHDSIVMDIYPPELNEIYEKLRQIMCEDIRKEWDWIIVPLDIEMKVSKIDGSWAEMSEMKISKDKEKSAQK